MKKPLSFVFIVGVVLAIIPVGWILSARSAATQDGLQAPIHVEGGAVIGTPAWAGGVRLYRGIPFAAPPVGDLRWKPPQPLIPWRGVLAANHFSAGPNLRLVSFFREAPGAEDPAIFQVPTISRANLSI